MPLKIFRTIEHPFKHLTSGGLLRPFFRPGETNVRTLEHLNTLDYSEIVVFQIWFYRPTKRRPRRDQFEWVESASLVVIVPAKKKEALALHGASYEEDEVEDEPESHSADDYSGAPFAAKGVKPTPNRKGLHFGGREFIINECVALNHGADHGSG